MNLVHAIVLALLGAPGTMGVEIGGGPYRLAVHYEWPVPADAGASPGLRSLALNINSEAPGDGKHRPVGAIELPRPPGPMIDALGLSCVRGPPNYFYHLDPVADAWPDPASGGKYEVCHVPTFNPLTDWRAGHEPLWDGTNYLFDASQGVAQHTVVIVFGYAAAGRLLTGVRNQPVVSDLTTEGIDTPPGKRHCTSVEWAPVGKGKCRIWVRDDACANAPCSARTIVNSDLSGSSTCPGKPDLVTLGNRVSGTAPTTVHLSSLNVYTH